MRSPRARTWLLCAALAGMLCVAACNSTKDALSILRCDQVLEPLVTRTFVQKAGPGAFACVRADAKTQADQALLREHCAVGGEPSEAVTYPARPLPMLAPKWWELKDGEDVWYSSLATDGGAWQSLAYRKDIAEAQVWFMCAGWL